MKIFLTGGAGYIGSITTECLLNEGHEVTVFDSLELGHRDAIDPRATLIQGNLCDREVVKEAMLSVRPDAIMHFAAYALVGESMENPLKYFHNNVTGGIHLVEAMLAANVKKFIFSSTCATYGFPERVPMTEDLPQRPVNPYGESKLMLERILLWTQELKGIEPVFLRYFNACGASPRYGEDHRPESHLIPLVLFVAQGKRDKIMIFGDDYETPDGTCIRDYIHILDLAQAHILAVTGHHTGAFNLGNGSGYSVKEVIDVARKVTGHAIPSEIVPRRPGDPDRLVASAKKAHDQLGWKPKYPDLTDIIEHAWAWHQANPDGYKA